MLCTMTSRRLIQCFSIRRYSVSALALAAAVLSGFLHAAWNAAVKASGDAKAAMTAQVVAAALIAGLLLPLVGPPAPASWPWLAASSALSIATLVTTRRAYQAGAFSVAYPVSRAMAPALVMVVGPLFGFGWPGPMGVVGLVLIGLGVLAFMKPPPSGPVSAAIPWALVTGVLTAGFVLVDSTGVRLAGSTLSYGLSVSMLNGLGFIALERGDTWGAVRRHWRLAVFGPLASLGSYLLILWVWATAPPALGAALRDTSLVFAALIGWRLLGERPTRLTWTALALATAGVVVLRFA